MKHVLTIAGSDSGGGAGIQADIKTMCALGVFAMSVITAVTAQNTMEVSRVQEVAPEMVKAQMKMVFDDIRVDAVKIGMVSSRAIIETIAETLREFKVKNIVLDPVMVSKSGYRLLQPEAESAIPALLAVSTLVTPNLMEAEILAGMPVNSEVDMRLAASRIAARGIAHVLVKGGHGTGPEAVDVLFTQGEFKTFSVPRQMTGEIHGSGCALSSAIASFIACGYSVPEAIGRAKQYITNGIEHMYRVGKGSGTVGHLWQLYQDAGLDV